MEYYAAIKRNVLLTHTTLYWVTEDHHKRKCTVYFHLYEVKGQARIINEDKKKNCG